ncbi:3'-5' exonuclease [Paraburkholderia humisilvae]|uniref:3'-5' exonuclease n=1 Tax=Paraburkholderia humisilvae TaxID=627669 RepID=UPI00361FB61E
MMKLKPTREQGAAIDLSMTGATFKVIARAGSGKTALLNMIATTKGRTPGVYLVFGRENAAEARQRLPKSVTCSTFHALAYRSLPPGITAKINNTTETLELLGLRMGFKPIVVPNIMGRMVELSGYHLAQMVNDAVARFCKSADLAPSVRHLDWNPVIERQAMEQVQLDLMPYVHALWAEFQSPTSRFRLSHNGYLKIWQLSQPEIEARYILQDEAQDGDDVMLDILDKQYHAQVIYAGDPHQQIMEFRGSVDAMQRVVAPETWLTESFRFGKSIADVSSLILRKLGETTPIRGQDSIHSVVIDEAHDIDIPVKAVLCRTNATAVAQMADELRAGRRVALRANISEIRSFCEAARQLMCGVSPDSSKALALFRDWMEVQDYAETFAGREIAPYVKLIDDHGPDLLEEMVRASVPDRHADITISTAHKAKGLEFDSVRVEGDFRFFLDTETNRMEQAEEETRLLYVAMTRARQWLDISPLAENFKMMLADARIIESPQECLM